MLKQQVQLLHRCTLKHLHNQASLDDDSRVIVH